MTVFPAYSLISLASPDTSSSSSMLETDLLTGLVALSFGWFPASFSAIVASSSSNLLSWAGCVGETTQEGYINPDFRLGISSFSLRWISVFNVLTKQWAPGCRFRDREVGF